MVKSIPSLNYLPDCLLSVGNKPQEIVNIHYNQENCIHDRVLSNLLVNSAGYPWNHLARFVCDGQIADFIVSVARQHLPVENLDCLTVVTVQVKIKVNSITITAKPISKQR